MSKTVKILFTLSVILNVLLLGTAGGFAYKKFQGAPWVAMRQSMPPETQKLMVDSFKNTWKDMKPLIDDARKARDDLRDVLVQDEFDSARYDEVMARLSKVQQDISAKKIAATKELVTQLKPEERKKIAGFVVSAFEWRGGARPHQGPPHREHSDQSPPPEDQKTPENP